MSESNKKPSFRGRETELQELRDWFNYAAEQRKPVLGVIVADSGLGKTRLVQKLYEQLSADLDPDSYWPDAFEDSDKSEDSGENLEVNPKLKEHEPKGAPEFIWLGIRFRNPSDRNYSFEPLLPNLREHTRRHRVVSDILKYPKIGEKIYDELRQRGRSFFSDNVDNLLENLSEEALGMVMDSIPSLRLIVSSIRTARQKQKAYRSESKRAHVHKEHAQDAFDQLAKELERFETYKKGQMPIILWLDDAQWIDEESVGVIEKLLDKAKDKRFTMMIIATHWEGDWIEYCEKSKGITRLFASNIDVMQIFDDDSEDMKYDAEDESSKRTILKLGKLRDETLRDLVKDNLPGLSENPNQMEMILEKVQGHILGLMEIVTSLGSDKLNFEDLDVNKQLSAAGEKQIRDMPTERNRQAERIFNLLDQGQKILLSLGSEAGTLSGFQQGVVCDAAKRLITTEFSDDDALKKYDTEKGLEEGLEKLGKRRLLAKHKEAEVWEFRDDLYYDLAYRYFKLKLSDFAHFLTSEIIKDTENQIQSCFDDDRKELKSLTTEGGLLARPPAERRQQLQAACKLLAGGKALGTENEPADFRARCLLVREYSTAAIQGGDTMKERAQEEGAKLKEYHWDKREEKSYVHQLGIEFRRELCNHLVQVESYDAALAIAHNLEIWFGDISGDTPSNRENLAKSKLEYARIVVKYRAAEKNDIQDWIEAERHCEDAIEIIDDLFGIKEDKEADPEWYTYRKDSNILLSSIKEKKGDEHSKKDAENLLLATKGHLQTLYGSSSTSENGELLASAYQQISELRIRQAKWDDAEDEAKEHKELLLKLCNLDSGDLDSGDLDSIVGKGSDYKFLEDYAACLEKLKDIYIRQENDKEAREHSELCLKIRAVIAEKARKDYEKGNYLGDDLEDCYEQYSDLAFSLAREDEKKGRAKESEEKLKHSRQAWRNCCKVRKDGNDGGIAALRKQGNFLHEWSKHKCEQIRECFDQAEKKVKEAADICSALDRRPDPKTIVLGKSYIKDALEYIEKTTDLGGATGKLLEECEEVRSAIVKDLKLSDSRKDQAETMLLLVEVLYDLYSLVGPQDQAGGRQGNVSAEKAELAEKLVKESMEERINNILSLCQYFRKEFIEDRKRIEARAFEFAEKVKVLKRDARQGHHKDLYTKCRELKEKIPKYDEKLHEAQSQTKLIADQAAISRKRRLQILVASSLLGGVLIVWALSASVTVVDLQVRTGRPAPVSLEWIEGGGTNLLGRILLWTDQARIQASAPGHQSAEAVLSGGGFGSTELVLQPLPGIAEIKVIGEGPITLSLGSVRQQAEPSMRLELAAGSHKALLDGPNIVPTEIDFEIQGFGNVQQFQWSAASTNSFLDVQVQPQTAEVLLDGQPWAVGSRKAGVPIGRHTLSASIPGWYSKSEEFEAVVDNVASFRWTLRPKPAMLALATVPSGVAVLLNGDYVGQSPVSLNLPANKRHVISARQSGRNAVELTLSPGPGERLERTLHLAANTKKVAFSANGPATVRVNGVHSGALPLTVELREGDRVEAVADGLAAAPYIVNKLESLASSHRFQLMPPDQLAHRSAPELEEVLPGLQLKRIPWSAMGATVSRPFRIAVQEVTYAAYSELLAQSPPSGLTAQHPVVNISWAQAAQFTNALSAKHGLPPVYVFDRSGYLISVNQRSLGFRLPTEAEWLAAAGPDWARPQGVVRPNWAGTERRSGQRMPGHTDRWLELAPAQQAVLGAFDLRGMAGNAAEWLHDYYAPWPSPPPPGYTGPALGIDHAVRGGSYLTAEEPEARGFSAKGRPDLGFRVAQWLY